MPTEGWCIAADGRHYPRNEIIPKDGGVWHWDINGELQQDQDKANYHDTLRDLFRMPNIPFPKDFTKDILREGYTKKDGRSTYAEGGISKLSTTLRSTQANKRITSTGRKASSSSGSGGLPLCLATHIFACNKRTANVGVKGEGTTKGIGKVTKLGDEALAMKYMAQRSLAVRPSPQGATDMTADNGYKETARNGTGMSYYYGGEVPVSDGAMETITDEQACYQTKAATTRDEMAPPASTKFVEMKWEVGGKLAANHQELDGGSPMDILLGMADARATSPQ